MKPWDQVAGPDQCRMYGLVELYDKRTFCIRCISGVLLCSSGVGRGGDQYHTVFIEVP